MANDFAIKIRSYGVSDRLRWQSPYKEEPARYRKALVKSPSIFGLIDVPGMLAFCSVPQVGGGSVSGKKKGIADGQLVLISGCVYDKDARWHQSIRTKVVRLSPTANDRPVGAYQWQPQVNGRCS